MNTPRITYQRLDAAETRAIADKLKLVYVAVFSMPPYNESPQMADGFTDWVSHETQHPGITMIVAYAEAEPVGFAYGYTLPAGQWIDRADRPEPGEMAATAKFGVMEWAVLPECRGAGVGRTLMESLLQGRPEKWAALTVNPAAEARAIYERAGWRQVASTPAFQCVPVYECYGARSFWKEQHQLIARQG